MVSSSPKASITYRRDKTRALLNTAEIMTGDFIRLRDANLRSHDRVAAIAGALGKDKLTTIDANALAARLMGDTIYTNVLLLGSAWQLGLVPVSLKALLRAIELNGIKIEANTRAFTWGRIAVANPQSLEEDPGGDGPGVPEALDGIVATRRNFLVDYQDEALAERYEELVDRTRAVEARLADDTALTEAVARSYFQLLSYKDEYEVARLHSRREFLDAIRHDYGSEARLRFHLAPPILNSGVDARGRPRKREFGAWILPVFRLLARMRRLRGTAFDVFGYTAERRMERALISEFESRVDELLRAASSRNIGEISAIVRRYLDIRGYGPVKEASVREVRAAVDVAVQNLRREPRRAA